MIQKTRFRPSLDADRASARFSSQVVIVMYRTEWPLAHDRPLRRPGPRRGTPAGSSFGPTVSLRAADRCTMATWVMLHP